MVSRIKKVEIFKEVIKALPHEKLVYVDETGFDQYLYREYARSPVGVKVEGIVSGKRFRRTSLVAGLVNRTELIAPLEYDGTMDGTLFEFWLTNCLMPELPSKSIVIMDNASFHRKKVLEEIFANTEHQLLFLPPYSPELNPIEKYWANLKKKLKKVLPYFDNFNDAFNYCFKPI